MDLSKTLRDFIDQEVATVIFPATVIAFDEDRALYDVRDADGNELYEVQMHAGEQFNGVVTYFKIGSPVIVGDIGGKGDRFVILASSAITQFEVRLDGKGNDSIILTESYCRITSPEIQLNGVDEAVIGPDLNDNLAQLNTNLSTALTALNTYATAQAAASTGTLAPLAPGYTALAAAITSLQTTVAAWEALLVNHLSDKVKLG